MYLKDGSVSISLQLWDTTGHERFRFLINDIIRVKSYIAAKPSKSF